MRIESTASSVSWIPTESVQGMTRTGFDVGLAHYDEPPPDVITGPAELRRQRDEDRFRFANVLSTWIDVEDGRVVGAGYADESGLVMGSTTVSIARLGATFHAHSLPVRRAHPDRWPDRVRFVQTVGGRTGVPLPRPVPHPPFVQWAAPLVWTTLEMIMHADGRSEVRMTEASPFPRHWVYGPDGRLAHKSALTDQATWVAHSFGARTPWGGDSTRALVVEAESELERRLSGVIMQSRQEPEVRHLSAGAYVTRQGQPGSELYLLLDGVVGVEVDGERVAELGPGAVLGERAVLEGGTRTATLVAVTPVRLAVAAADTIDVDHLRALAQGHQREAVTAPASAEPEHGQPDTGAG